MNLVSALKSIKEAQDNNQLVIFVGAGVSKNSGLPSWYELIKNIADKIDYNEKCKICDDKGDNCPKKDCKKRYEFSQEEFLKIPEYFFNCDNSINHTEYYDFISESLKYEKKVNLIDDEVFKILPRHIITTNYDTLLEDSNTVNRKLYTVVAKDADLLSNSKDRYILKMHGDITEPKTIVLKESDYIKYEQEHPLITTFIKSLLVNHTFLFIGYGLNDYNLNLIIGWINYFKEVNDIKNSPQNFILQYKEASEFEKNRLKNKNINVVDLKEIPEEIYNDVEIADDLAHKEGKSLYVCLKCINDDKIFQKYITFEGFIKYKLSLLKSYKRISFLDVKDVLLLDGIELLGDVLCFWDKEEFNVISNLIDNNEDIIELLNKAGINNIKLCSGIEYKAVPMVLKKDSSRFQLYLDNDYSRLDDSLKECTLYSEKIYYYKLLDYDIKDISELIKEEQSKLVDADYIDIILHKLRSIYASTSIGNWQRESIKEITKVFNTMSPSHKSSCRFLEILHNKPWQNLHKMKELVEKVEVRYEYDNTKWYSDSSFNNIFMIQAYVYDYYFFIKENFLPIDGFTNPRVYFRYYLQSVMCSYSPQPADKGVYDFFLNTDRYQFELNEIDVDIFVKFGEKKHLEKWIKKYHVQELRVDGTLDLVKKFVNLCNSYLKFKNIYWINQIHNFIMLCSLANISCDRKKEVLKTLVGFINHILMDRGMLNHNLYDILNYVIDAFDEKVYFEEFVELSEVLISKVHLSKFVNDMHGGNLRVVQRVAAFSSGDNNVLINSYVENVAELEDKCMLIYILREILPFERYRNFIIANINVLSLDSLFHLIIEKKIELNDKVMEIFLTVLKEESQKRDDNPNYRSFPDLLGTVIEYFIIFKLFGITFDISILALYKKYSVQLEFLFDPQNFDYGKVDIKNYMWGNLIYSKDYQHYFVEHKQFIINDELKKAFRLGVADERQRKIVYGILLDKEDIRSFGH